MADKQQPAKKVVKRVVKRSVATPPAQKTAAPTVRYGRKVTSAPKAKAPAKPRAKAAAPAKPARAPSRPRVDVGGKLKGAVSSIGGRGASAASGLGGATRHASRSAGSVIAGRASAVRAWRIPHWPPLPAALFTGVFVGLLTVGLAVAAKALFSEVRGVAGGGGKWGSLTFVVLIFIAFVAGDRLLAAFGTRQSRLTSFLAVVLSIIVIMGIFLVPADTVWAVLIVPAVGALAYAVSHWLLELAESTSPQLD